MSKNVVIIIGCLVVGVILLCLALAIAGGLWYYLSFGSFDDSDYVGTSDPTVSQADMTRITSHLLASVPKIREEKTRLIAEGNPRVKLSVNILNAPEPDRSQDDPDRRYHAEYYWIYVSYSGENGLLKYDTYLVHKDLRDIYIVDAERDEFVKIGS